VLLSVMGGALGAGLAYAGVRVLLAIGPANLPRLSDISLDSRTFGFAAVLSLLYAMVPVILVIAAVLASCLPARRACPSIR